MVLGVGGALVAIVVVCILAVALLGTPAPSDTSVAAAVIDETGPTTTVAWVPWTAADGSFSLAFPVAPEPAGQLPGAGNLDHGEAVLAQVGSTEYASILYTYAPGYVPDDEAALVTATVDGAAKGGGITILTREWGNVAGSPSLTFRGSANDGEASVRGVAFNAPGCTHLLVVISGAGDAVDFDRFVASYTPS